MKKHRDNTIDMFAPVVKPLEQYRQETMEAAKGDGTACPCCNQFVKIYRRTITSTMARQLITAFHKFAGKPDSPLGHTRWFHVRDVMGQDDSGAGDFAKLEIWGLIERQEHKQGEDGKRTSGMWRITHRGMQFVNCRLSVPMYAMIYNGTVLETTGEDINIHHALGKKYDYKEIMGWTGAARTGV